MHDSSDDTPNGRQSPAARPPRDSAVAATAVRASAAGSDDSPSPVPSTTNPLKVSGSRETTLPWGEEERTSKPADPLVGMQVGEYVVKRRLGAGGMGLVYEAEQPMIGRRVAIKVLKPEISQNPDQMRTLLDEAKASNAIRHRGIIDIFGFGQIPGVGQYMVMEYLEGEPLDELIRRRAPMMAADAIPILDETLAALSAAHAEGVIHRDLKPSNIFMALESTGSSYVKLLDFGLAKQAQMPHGMARQTRASVMVGTPEYMAPEQACGQTVGPMSDLYALGVIAFEMLAGRLPFEGANPLQIAISHVNTAPPSPSEFAPVPAELDALIMDLLEKEPQKRPVSAEVVRQRLKRIANSLAHEKTQVRVDPKKLTGPRPAYEPPKAPVAAPAPKPPPPAAPAAKAPPAPPNIVVAPSLKTVSTTDDEQQVRTPDTDRSPSLAPSRSKVPLYIGGGVLLFGLAVGGGFLLKRGTAPNPVPPDVVAVPEVKPQELQPPEEEKFAAPVIEEKKPNPIIEQPVKQKEPPKLVEKAPAVTPAEKVAEKKVVAQKKVEPVEVGTGIVHFTVMEWADVSVDGKKLGRLKSFKNNEIELPAGRHTILLENGVGAGRRTFTITTMVKPNKKFDYTVVWESAPQ